MAKLAESMTEKETEKIKTESKKFIENHSSLGPRFKKLIQEDRDWILKYLFEGKHVIPYEMMNSFDSLDIAPTSDFLA